MDTQSPEAKPKEHVEILDRVVIRFAGDSGDGMQLTGTQFTATAAALGNDLATLPDYPAEIGSSSGRTGRATPTWTRPSCTWPGARAAPSSSRSSTPPSSSPRSAGARGRTWGRAGSSTAWDATTPSHGASSAVNPKTHVPANNGVLVGAIALVGAFTVSYQLGAELLNFGAFIAFMGVNASSFVHYWLRAEKKKLINLLPPVLGFSICFYIWLSLRTPAKIVGFLWLLTGILYGAWKTQGFKKPIEFREAGDEEGR